MRLFHIGLLLFQRHTVQYFHLYFYSRKQLHCLSSFFSVNLTPCSEVTQCIRMLMTTQIQIHIRFLDFQNWPHCLWTLTSKYNPDGKIAKCEQFLLSSRDMFDAGYTQLLFDDAWQAGDLLTALLNFSLRKKRKTNCARSWNAQKRQA